MPNKMLIDASHPEETRVVVLRGNRVEEFDFESANKKQLRGNIYLAKVTRVEPSLQAAFVDYGGNRHGFLAFSEIHPDYYQIPVADRQALIEEEARAQRAEEENESRGTNHRRSRRHNSNRSGAAQRRGPDDETLSEAAEGGNVEEVGYSADHDHVEHLDHSGHSAESEHDAPSHHDRDEVGHDEPVAAADAAHDHIGHASDDEAHTPVPVEAGEQSSDEHPHAVDKEEAVEARHADPDHHDRDAVAEDHESVGHGQDHEDGVDERPAAGDHATVHEDEDDGEEEDSEAPVIEQIGGDALEEVPYRSQRPRRAYKIQEVIKRRQVLLVQVAKEERGNKGAALTTYLSLAGRYSVLMPNTARGGGISRKITNAIDRKRLKSIAEELEVPEGMGIILRTAGAARTKAEVKRDFEYLLRMWETVRELTLKSTAPTLVYEEGSLIKRAIRDLYNKDVDEVNVAGEEGFREAKEFMRLLMPSHAKNVKLYRDPEPMFVRSGAESQLDAMFANQVTLKSGGYIVINQTEALVAIDVNSGRSTREHNIEDTALRTNMEAADEVARQLRLRDLAGLIVVDFIDMEEGRNNRAIERRMKDALKFDRARIQIGRISHFGLLEMSRQRIRTGVLEGSTVPCPHCMGAGMVRSTSSISLHVLRSLEEALIRNANYNIVLHTRLEVALYVLNQKRAHLREIEGRFGVSVTVLADPTLTGTVYHAVERGEAVDPETASRKRAELVRIDSVRPIFDDEDEADTVEETETEEVEVVAVALAEDHAEETDDQNDGSERDEEGAAQAEGEQDGETDADGTRRRRRRRRRRGRDRDGRSTISANAPQPSDDGLAAVGEIMGLTPVYKGNGLAPESMSAEAGHAPVQTAEVHAEVEPAPVVVEQEPAPATAVADVLEPVVGQHAIEAPSAPEHAPPLAEIEAPAKEPEAVTEAPLANGAEHQPAEPAAEAEPATAAEPEVEESTLPKRSGWWQRAKATFGG